MTFTAPNLGQETMPTVTNGIPSVQKPGVNALSATDQSAKAIITNALNNYGLSSLADWAWQQYTGGSSPDTIMLDLRQRPEYAARFPAMAALAQKGQAITEGQYIQYETSVSQVMRANGIPSGFYDQPSDITKFLTNNVSVAEIQSRVQDAAAAIFTSSPEVRGQLNALYGAGASQGQITAWFLDPNRAEPLIAKEWAAAQASGQGVISGYGALNQNEAESVGAAGVSQQGLQQGFAQLVQQQGLYQRELGAHPDSASAIVSRHQQLGAAFLGDAKAQQAITQEAGQRKADQEGGTSFVKDQQGYAGLGVQPQ